jgi:DNA-directed RNA polymerase specialized sigma24 family protein
VSDRDLVAALRAGDRLAAGQVYDVYGTRLYAYCHELLADPKLSADALRDTFIVAVNRVRELNEPEEFGAWLYALARAECVRVGVSDDAPADAAGAARGDRLARLALDCYSMLEPEQRELLDLAFRHRLVDGDLALVLGLDESAIAARVADAQGDLETALLVVLAARTGDPRCEEAAEFGRKFDDIDGKGVSIWLQTAAKHVERCSICGDAVRNRRPLRLFEELPHSFMPPGVRSRVLEALRDPGGTAFAERIAERAGRFDENGFPAGQRGAGQSRLRKWILPGAGLVAAAAIVIGFVLMTSDHPANTATVTTSSTTGASVAAVPSSSASGFAELTGTASAKASSSASTSGAPSSANSSSAVGGGQPVDPPSSNQNVPPPTTARSTPPSSRPASPPSSPASSTPSSTPPTSSSPSTSGSPSDSSSSG